VHSSVWCRLASTTFLLRLLVTPGPQNVTQRALMFPRTCQSRPHADNFSEPSSPYFTAAMAGEGFTSVCTNHKHFKNVQGILNTCNTELLRSLLGGCAAGAASGRGLPPLRGPGGRCILARHSRRAAARVPSDASRSGAARVRAAARHRRSRGARHCELGARMQLSEARSLSWRLC
jgi:hypothetical protein